MIAIRMIRVNEGGTHVDVEILQNYRWPVLSLANERTRWLAI